MSLGSAEAPGAPPPAGFSPNVAADVAAGETSASGQNEPQVTTDQSGKTYLTWQVGQICADVTTTTDGVHFSAAQYPDASFNPGLGCEGDVIFAHTAYTNLTKDIPVQNNGDNSVFWGDIGPAGSPCPDTPLNIQVGNTLDAGATWTNQGGAGCQAERVDRPWIAGFTPPAARGTANAANDTILYVEYHDFVQSDVWMESSPMGGVQNTSAVPPTSTWGPTAENIEQAGSVGQATSTLNSIPGGVAVDNYGSHVGRVYAVWSTSDITTNASQGGNYSQAEPFDHIFLSWCQPTAPAYTDCTRPTATWTTTTVFNDPCAPNPPTPPASVTPTNPAGTCQDVSELFTPVAVDDAGNVYVAFVWRDITKAKPEYDVYMEVSKDGGNTFNGGNLNQPGSPIDINNNATTTDVGTHYSPWLAAAGNGGVDVVYYDAHNLDGGVGGVGEFNKPAALPGNALWTFRMSQTLDSGQTWTQSPVSDHVQYYGDYCTVGIFCLPTGGQNSTTGWGEDRILYEDPGVAVGPDGGARVIWTDASSSYACAPTSAGTCPAVAKPGACTPPTAPSDPNYATDNNVSCQSGQTHVDFACQTSGMGLTGQAIAACGVDALAVSTPEAGLATLLLVAGVVAMGASTLWARRRRRWASGISL